MLNYSEYEEITRAMIFGYLPKKLSFCILKDNQLFGELVSSIMESDWKHERDSKNIITKKDDNAGYRILGFRWKIGAYKRWLIQQQKYGVLRCASFDGMGDTKYKPNDVNMFFEDFKSAINTNKNLKPKERQDLIELFCDNKQILDSKNKYTRVQRINKGISKLPGEYGIFTIKRLRKTRP